MNCAENRQYVQNGLDQKKADAKRKEAALDAQERQLRLTINGNHTMRTLTEAQRRAMELEEQERRKAARREARAHAREREEKATLAVQRYIRACVGILLLVGFTSFPWWAAVTLTLGLAVFPAAYIYRLYVPVEVRA